MNDLKFYYCKKCHNLVILLHEGGGKLSCCGEEMELLEAGTTDAAREKHVPAVTRENNLVKVQVGEVAHPMLDKHYITFILCQQGDRYEVQTLKPGEAPEAEFSVEDGPVRVYEFCNLHGLWMAEA